MHMYKLRLTSVPVDLRCNMHYCIVASLTTSKGQLKTPFADDELKA